MENASKALLMSAGVLIGVLILSLFVYLFSSFTSVARGIDKENNQKAITQFNSNFTRYSQEDNITIYDIITAKNFANEVNINRSSNQHIKVFIKNKDITNQNKNEDKKLIEKDLETEGIAIAGSQTYDGSSKMPKYKVTLLDYDEDGKVNKIVFQLK